MSGRRLLLTRSAEDNRRLATRLAAAGVDTLNIPLICIEPCEETFAQRQQMLDLDRYQAVVVVSPVAARQGLERLDRYWPQAPSDIEWLAVGATTASVLSEYGLPVCRPDDGQDSEALLRLPIWQQLLAVPNLKVLIWRGVGGREHIAETVRGAGGQVDYLELYRRTQPAGLGDQLLAASGQGVQGILISSGQALEHWHDAAAQQWTAQRHWRCLVPSQRVAKRAAELGCTDIVVCDGADDAAVLAAIAAHPLTQQGEQRGTD
ncbi:uroporphyrinogen-III synthase [Halopseudomonas xinjiangensis]|uniref:Uroporphyrinogen-III synthase n=1 Tax=Halopseudomonas xinjiangensis TaxID=487184 RepID=A0A1H1YJ45_9GAMM|nr:uroporphyrinogen-III synthase [Halopseudomonas xinjiangensis]SDT21345.1 uroporphyrinogen-III synthase [Halopseudomonas xinjiangensis]